VFCSRGVADGIGREGRRKNPFTIGFAVLLRAGRETIAHLPAATTRVPRRRDCRAVLLSPVHTKPLACLRCVEPTVHVVSIDNTGIETTLMCLGSGLASTQLEPNEELPTGRSTSTFHCHR